MMHRRLFLAILAGTPITQALPTCFPCERKPETIEVVIPREDAVWDAKHLLHTSRRLLEASREALLGRKWAFIETYECWEDPVHRSVHYRITEGLSPIHASGVVFLMPQALWLAINYGRFASPEQRDLIHERGDFSFSAL